MNISTTTPDKSVLLEIGKRLAQYRLNANWTQRKLATEAGIALPTVQRLEAGQSIQAVSLLRVMRALGLLSHMDVAIPAVPASPIQTLERMGKHRKRASSENEEKAPKPGGWTWGDEE